MPTQVLKDPAAKLDYGVNWAPWLAVGETITASTWTVDTGLTVTTPAASFTGTATTVWLLGGTVGTTYKAVNQVTTSAGRIDERTLTIEIVDR
jgi:hypothetical protein